MEERAPAHAYAYLTQPEVRFLDAAVARLIPADELGPGAKEADVTYFIDQQLAGSWGMHGRNYRMGPWQEGTPQQGFQSPADAAGDLPRRHPRDGPVLHAGATARRSASSRPSSRTRSCATSKTARSQLESLSSKLFFGLLWKNTEEGFFADPMYGGNRDKIGWKLVGFPGVAASNYNAASGQAQRALSRRARQHPRHPARTK